MRPSFRLSTIAVTFFLMISLSLSERARSAPPPSPSEMPGAGKSPGGAATASATTLSVPGPLRSFLRMAAVSQQASSEEILPLLARQVMMGGYAGSGKDRRPTEYLILLKRYVEQARELQKLAGSRDVLHFDNCKAAQPLLEILGYRLRQPCGPDASLEAAGPKRAFLTVDSGFPLVQLEEMLRQDKPFDYPYASSQVPVLYGQSDWTAMDKDKNHKDILDAILGDPALARLYWALAQLDEETRTSLRQSPGIEKLLPLAPALDFYGDQIHIRSGRVETPGGAPAESAWKQLVGASPDSPGEFVTKLLGKDGGWLAAYYDALSRISGTQQAYFTEPERLGHFYEALLGRDASPSPVRSIFRPDPDLLLLVTRVQLESNGQPHIPGNLGIWSDILHEAKDSKTARVRREQNIRFNNPEQFLEALFALSRVGSGRGPIEVYLTLSEIDRARSPQPPLSPKLASYMTQKFSRFGQQYLIFSEFHELNDASILAFLNTAEALDRITDVVLRSEGIGIFQANLGLWQMLARQGQIPTANWNSSWQRVIHPLFDLRSKPQLFDAARSSLGELMREATGKRQLSQSEIVATIAGPTPNSLEASQARDRLANRIRSVLEAQRLVSLDTILALADGLNQTAQGKVKAETLIPLAEEVSDFEMPKPVFTTGERLEWDTLPYGDRHTQAEVDTNLVGILKSPGAAGDIAEARGLLLPFLRDFLVGLNYAYYEPPGAQMLHHNALFVRRHDFSADARRGGRQPWETPELVGRGVTSGSGVYLAGGLTDLAYVLAGVEQEFIVPKNVQSLIWEDLVPSLVASAVVPRWWRVTRNELHAVALYQRFGEELLTAAGENEELRQRAISFLSNRISSCRLGEVESALRAQHAEEALSRVTPAETFYLGVEFQSQYPKEPHRWGNAGQELEKLVQRYPEEVNRQRLSEDFGVPHPALGQTYARELLNLKPFPTFQGYSSRLLAESWDSNNLYWARLADEKGLPPEMLHRLVPELTRQMVENIFATHLDDWPALLRALRETGEQFREGETGSLPKRSAVSPF